MSKIITISLLLFNDLSAGIQMRHMNQLYIQDMLGDTLSGFSKGVDRLTGMGDDSYL